MAKTKAETYLRQVQRGEKPRKTTGFSSGFSFNSDRIQIFKPRQIIKPYLHSIDARRIDDEIKKVVREDGVNQRDPKLQEKLDKLLPKHLIEDLYSLYYNRSENMRFETLDKTNTTKFSILKNVNNSIMKIVTNSSHIASHIFTQEISKFLYKKFSELTPEEQEKLAKDFENCNQGEEGNEEGQGSGKGSGQQDGEGNSQGQKPSPGSSKGKEQAIGDGHIQGDGSGELEAGDQSVGQNASGPAVNTPGKTTKAPTTQTDVDNMINSLLNTKKSQKEFEESLQKAEAQLDKLKEAGLDVETTDQLPEIEQQEILNNLKNLDSLRSELKALSISKDKVLKAVEKMLSSSNNYFSKKCKMNEVEIFEADEVLEVNGIELLHPVFRKSRITELTITERKYIGKFDLYVDCSGSMDAGTNFGVSRIQLAKALALQMKEMGILGDLFEFEGSVKHIMNTEISILMMDARGGTDIESVMRNIVKTGNNSVVLTDGESGLNTYSHKAFFIGIGTDFRYFQGDKQRDVEKQNVGQKLIEYGQCLMYSGNDFVMKTFDN